MVPALPTAVPRLSADWRAQRHYWQAQVFGWLAVALFLFVHALLYSAPGAGGGARLVEHGWVAFCGAASTHLLRGWLRRTGALGGAWPRLVGCGVAGVVGAGVLMAGAIFVLPLLLPALADDIWTNTPTAAFVARVFLSAALCTGWLLLFLGHESGRSFQAAQTERARYEAALKDAELRALRGQLNPHFLFNALNVVRRLAATDPSRTRQAITQLAGLLRDTLNGSEEPAIKLSAELRQVDAYLQLEKLRFEERLEIVWNVPDDALARPVPPFSVLTLVENAVKHGIASRIAGGRLEVSATTETVATVVRVANSGVLPADPRTGRVGMQNLRERLRLLYGDAAVLELRAGAPEEVVAELRVPAAWPARGLTPTAAAGGSGDAP